MEHEKRLSEREIRDKIFLLKGAYDHHCTITRALEKSLLAPQANVFRMVGYARKETKQTLFLQSLLDPNGDHGMGTLPLRTFIKELNSAIEHSKCLYFERARHPLQYLKAMSPSQANNSIVFFSDLPSESFDNYTWSVCSEHAERGVGRFDLVIQGIPKNTISDSSGVLIILENKIGASDAKGQLDSYYNWLAKPNVEDDDDLRCKCNNRWLIFLRPSSEDLPKMISSNESKCVLMSYSSAPNEEPSLKSIIDSLISDLPSQSRMHFILEQYLDILNEIQPFKSKPLKVDSSLAALLVNNKDIYSIWYEIFCKKTDNFDREAFKKSTPVGALSEDINLDYFTEELKANDLTYAVSMHILDALMEQFESETTLASLLPQSRYEFSSKTAMKWQYTPDECADLSNVYYPSMRIHRFVFAARGSLSIRVYATKLDNGTLNLPSTNYDEYNGKKRIIPRSNTELKIQEIINSIPLDKRTFSRPGYHFALEAPVMNNNNKNVTCLLNHTFDLLDLFYLLKTIEDVADFIKDALKELFSKMHDEFDSILLVQRENGDKEE